MWGHSQPSKRSTFNWNPGWKSLQDGLPGPVLSQSCVFLLKIGREPRSAAKLTQKSVLKEQAALVSSPLTQTKAQYPKFPLWKVGTEGTTSPSTTVGGTSPKFKAFHPILVPCPLPMTFEALGWQCWGSEKWFIFGIFLLIRDYFTSFSIQKDKIKWKWNISQTF